MKLLPVFLSSLLFLSMSQLVLANIRSAHYTKLSYVHFSGASEEDLCRYRRCDGSWRWCAYACEMSPSCTSLTYDTVVKTCHKNNGDIYTFGTSTLVSSNHSHYVGKIKQDVTDGDWIVVFRGQANNTASIRSAYLNVSYLSDGNMRLLDLKSVSKLSDVTSAHYRSRWLNTWPSHVIDQVKFELYEKGSTVVSLIFNGTGSNISNWFSYERLLSSGHYTDLTEAPAVFSLMGTHTRAFYITNTSSYFTCSQKAWLIIEDKKDRTCSWSAQDKPPRLLYSKTTKKVSFGERPPVFGQAEVMAILIKLKGP